MGPLRVDAGTERDSSDNEEDEEDESFLLDGLKRRDDTRRSISDTTFSCASSSFLNLSTSVVERLQIVK